MRTDSRRQSTSPSAALGLGFSRKVRTPVHYRGRRLGHTRVDFVIEEVLVEVKAKDQIGDVDVIQALCYLRPPGLSGRIAAQAWGKVAGHQAAG
jgi:hypothetical protein